MENRRLYKSKEEYLQGGVLDDRHEWVDRFRSKCYKCKYFEEWDYFCAAFPEGIPFKYLNAEKHHTAIDDRQTGELVFTAI
jgi:hypothetical protein